jgi:FkbM family methyltransferase
MVKFGNQDEFATIVMHNANQIEYQLGLIPTKEFIESLYEFYESLADENSRELWVRLCLQKIVKQRNQALIQIHSPEFYQDIQNRFIAQHAELQKKFALPFEDNDNYSIRETFIHEAYKYNEDIQVKLTDSVYDIGACIGDTAIYFAEKAYEGFVWSFEPFPRAYEKLCKNTDYYTNVKAYNLALGNEIKEFTAYEDSIVETSSLLTSNGAKQVTIKMVTLDSIVNQLVEPTFIKMDTEGFEKEILIGAEQTIKKFKPTLAVSLYHKPDDYITLPKLIHSYIPKYKFYLKHNSNTDIETVLFAVY